ncbi:MAG: redoxin domain-containing protein [Solirubrobacterales bacterium]
MLEAGDAAPDFTLPDQDGAELALSDLRGETVVLYFYPRADTMSYNCSNGSAGRHRHHPSL